MGNGDGGGDGEWNCGGMSRESASHVRDVNVNTCVWVAVVVVVVTGKIFQKGKNMEV